METKENKRKLTSNVHTVCVSLSCSHRISPAARIIMIHFNTVILVFAKASTQKIKTVKIKEDLTMTQIKFRHFDEREREKDITFVSIR